MTVMSRTPVATTGTQQDNGHRLHELRPAATARVTGFDAMPTAVRRRLEDLGLEEGAEITMLRRAPLGDPCIYRVRDYDLCLRRREAREIRCESCEQTQELW